MEITSITELTPGGSGGLTAATAAKGGHAFMAIIEALLAAPATDPRLTLLEASTQHPDSPTAAVPGGKPMHEDAEAEVLPAETLVDLLGSQAQIAVDPTLRVPADPVQSQPQPPSVEMPPQPPAFAFPATADFAAARQALPDSAARMAVSEVRGDVDAALRLAGMEEVKLPVALARALVVPEQDAAGLAPVSDSLTAPPAMQSLVQERVVEGLSRPVATPQSAQLALSAPLGSKEWSSDFAQRVTWMAGQRLQLAEIAVNPPNLGGVEVRLSMHDQSAGAQFYASNPSVRDALEAALPRLRDMLAEAGIHLAQAEVRDQAFADRQAWARDEAAAHLADEAAGLVPAAPVRTLRGHGLIDLYA